MAWHPVTWKRSLRRWWALRRGRFDPETRRAIDLIRAIDAGGVPLNPAQVNAIARGLGLEVSARAPVEQTIARIRQALERALPR